MAGNIITLTDASFDEEVASADVPVLVDFWAEWCGPCKVIAPVLEEIAAAKTGALKVAKVNIDDNPQITQRFQVMSIPTLVLFKDGQPQSRMIGAKPKSAILAEVEPHLG